MHLFDLSVRFITLQVRKCHFLIYLFLFFHLQLGKSPLSLSAFQGILGRSIMRYLVQYSPIMDEQKSLVYFSSSHSPVFAGLAQDTDSQFIAFSTTSENLKLLELKQTLKIIQHNQLSPVLELINWRSHRLFLVILWKHKIRQKGCMPS